ARGDTPEARSARNSEARGARKTMRRVAITLVLAVLAVFACALPAWAAPRLAPAARAGRITVLAEPGLDDVARDLAASSERALDRISADLLDLATPRAIEVRLVRDASDLAAVAPAGR